MALNKADIRSQAGMVDTRDVHVPKWRNAAGDDVVRVRGLTLKELELLGEGGLSGLNSARALAGAIIDETGGRVFDHDPEDYATIGELPAAQAQELMAAVNELSGFGSTPAAQAAIDADIAGESGAQTSST